MGRFKRKGQRVRLSLSGFEPQILRQLVEELIELLGGEDAVSEEPAPGAPDAFDDLVASTGIGTATALPEDEVLARLLPDAYQDDPEAAGEFRRYTEDTLRRGKIDAARCVLATLDAGSAAELDDEQCQAWLGVLNDLRLALGVRLGLRTEDDYDALDAMGDDDPRRGAWDVYQWMGYLQETLLEALT